MMVLLSLEFYFAGSSLEALGHQLSMRFEDQE